MLGLDAHGCCLALLRLASSLSFLPCSTCACQVLYTSCSNLLFLPEGDQMIVMMTSIASVTFLDVHVLGRIRRSFSVVQRTVSLARRPATMQLLNLQRSRSLFS